MSGMNDILYFFGLDRAPDVRCWHGICNHGVSRSGLSMSVMPTYFYKLGRVLQMVI